MRDLIDLYQRLASRSTPIATPSPPPTTTIVPGTRTSFWVDNEQTKSYFQMTARVLLKTDHVDWYGQEGLDLPMSDVQAAASYFEQTTYPTEHRLFGSERSAGTGGKITILMGRIPLVGGYFSSEDEYPRAVNRYSNEREMIYINTDAVRPGSPGFNATVAHEFQHMIQFNVHRNQDAWVNEGSAELAAEAVTGNPSSTVNSFERSPDTQLTQWASDPAPAVPHYGAAFLFMQYVAEHFGGYATIGRVVAEPGRGSQAFQELFQTLSPPRSFDDVFADWIAANELDDPSLASGQYGYKQIKLHPAVQPGPALGQVMKGLATQYGTSYYQIQTDRPATLSFQGSTTVPLVGAEPRDGQYEWWANRGDSIDTRLTRSFDLTAVKAASLGFWIWYDVEKDYDYAYVEASVDDGKTWTTLPATDTTTSNPNGQNYGNGFTGTSGGSQPSWRHETADLSPYAGKKIQLRFEYVTDDSYNGDGVAVDGVQIPEIGFDDNVATDDAWAADGFARITDRIPQPYVVEVLAPSGPNPVRRMTIGADGTGRIDVPAGNAVVAVAGLAPITIHQSAYQLALAAP